MNQLNKMLGLKSPIKSEPSIEDQLLKFQQVNNLLIPEDLKEYFRLLKNTEMKYNENLYQFYPLSEFKSVGEELKNFNGIPDYSNIVNTLSDYKYCFLFADYMFHMFSYAIRLHNNNSGKNEIFIVCGDKYKIIANSFNQFVSLYVSESIELQFSD